MGFFSGRVSFLRFEVKGKSPRVFGKEHLDRLTDRHAGRQRIASADGIETGWTAGDHILDTEFELAKNIINDTLTFDLRVDVDKIPSDLLRAYYAVELKALTKKKPQRIAQHQAKARSEGNRTRPTGTGGQGRALSQAKVLPSPVGSALQ